MTKTELVNVQEVETYKSQVTELEHKANELTITTPEENAFAIELKAKLDATGKDIKVKKETITKPLNAALKAAREMFAPVEAMFANADATVGRKLLDYKRKIDEENRKKESQIAARVEKGTMRLDTAEKKLEQLPQIQKTTHTDAGAVQFRVIKKVRIIDEAKIPDQYWVLDMVAVRRDALSGTLTSGVEVYNEETV